MGVTPMAFSISAHIISSSANGLGDMRWEPTPEGVETETIDLFEFRGVLIIVLDYIDEVRGCEEASKRGAFTIPQRCRHNSYTIF